MFFDNLYSLKIFNGFDKYTVDKIVEKCEIRLYKNGDIILKEGDNSNGEGYIIKKGIVLVSIGGKKIVELNPGDIVGEIALLNEEQRTATVKAITDIEVIVLKMENLVEIINNDENNLSKTILKRIEENIERE